MKRKLKICVACLIGLMLIFVGICLAVAAWGQEGCGDWYYELKWDDMIIRIRLDTLWFVGDSVWIQKYGWDCGHLVSAEFDTVVHPAWGIEEETKVETVYVYRPCDEEPCAEVWLNLQTVYDLIKEIQSARRKR